jgi:hypothetical protein
MALYDCLFEEDQEDSSSASESKVLLAHLLCACVCTRGGRLLCSSASALAQFVPHRTCWSHFVWWFGKRITSTEGLSEHALRRRMYVSNLVVVVGWVGNTELGIYSRCELFVCPSLIMLLSLASSQKQGRNEDGILNEFDHIAVASVHAFLQVNKLLLQLLIYRGCMCCDWPLPRWLFLSFRAVSVAHVSTLLRHRHLLPVVPLCIPTSLHCRTFSLPHVLLVIAARCRTCTSTPPRTSRSIAGTC